MDNDGLDIKAVFEKYFSSLCIFAQGFVSFEESKDAVQEVFIKIWNSPVHFENETALKAYLYLLTRNKCIDVIRKQKKRKIVLLTPENEKELDSIMVNEIVKEETFSLLDEIISDFGDKSKKILKLFMEGKANKEIADDLQISINTVKTLKLRAYKKIRTKIEL